MDKAQEDRALSPAVDRMESRFPDVPRDEIEQTVAQVQEEFADQPLRDHIPNLVEHEVRSRLTDAHGTNRAAEPGVEPQSSDSADPTEDGFDARQPS